MARPSRTGGSAAKTRKASSVKSHNPAKTKRRIELTTVRLKRPTVSGLGKELEEAREQQVATAEILKVIANSPDDLPSEMFPQVLTSAHWGHSGLDLLRLGSSLFDRCCRKMPGGSGFALGGSVFAFSWLGVAA